MPPLTPDEEKEAAQASVRAENRMASMGKLQGPWTWWRCGRCACRRLACPADQGKCWMCGSVLSPEPR